MLLAITTIGLPSVDLGQKMTQHTRLSKEQSRQRLQIQLERCATLEKVYRTQRLEQRNWGINLFARDHPVAQGQLDRLPWRALRLSPALSAFLQPRPAALAVMIDYSWETLAQVSVTLHLDLETI